MKMFGNLGTDGLEKAGDVLGGGTLFDTGVYENGTVTLAHAGNSASSKARSVTVHIDFDGREYRETFWVTNRDGENFYLGRKEPRKKTVLPGFQAIDELCLATTGQGLAEQVFEEKVVKLWDFEARAEVPQTVPVLTGILGAKVSAAIWRQTVNRQKRNDQGAYVDTGETRDENAVEKFFHAGSRRTVAEAMNGIEEAVFIDRWAERNAGRTRDRTRPADGTSGAPGIPGARPAPAPTPKPRTSLFGT